MNLPPKVLAGEDTAITIMLPNKHRTVTLGDLSMNAWSEVTTMSANNC